MAVEWYFGGALPTYDLGSFTINTRFDKANPQTRGTFT